MQRVDVVLENAISAIIEKDSKEQENNAIQSGNVVESVVGGFKIAATPTDTVKFYTSWKMLETPAQRSAFLKVVCAFYL